MLQLLDASGALLVAAVGVLLICAEFCLPGWVIPGVTGGVCFLCGVYRLSLLGGSGPVAAVLLLLMIGVAAAGYGMVPPWVGLVLLSGVPWLCRSLVPGAISWVAAGLAALPPIVMFGLLRVAARAVLNKTLLQ